VRTAIIIPARYGSTRFPGKPLAPLAGKTVLHRVADLARQAAAGGKDITIHVTTDDDRIAAEADRIGIECLRTSADCPTGTDRVMAAASQLKDAPDFIINLQGDAPLTPPDFVTAMIEAFATSKADIVTPVVRLSWEDLDTLRESKKQTPFSGTTATFDAQGKALWFSKNIIPAIRKEEALRAASPLSPVHRHIGLYGYARAALDKYIGLPAGTYEELEGLEQLRALENGMTIQCVTVDYKGRPAMTGIDSPEDLIRAEKLLAS
jgi:3-deoxy-manno-octulosonate cytidylyltransferase (CMP-KDO synthetase)